ncbi:hypothetical protein ERO13_D07G060000v2 [Gossypium hirsutum]|nr:hypothetical protein ERO13_D07G060000v2 [Gossypium hirsutum]
MVKSSKFQQRVNQKRKQVEIDNQITKFLNPIDFTENELWWSTESSIRISYFQDFQWHVFNPKRILISSKTNELKSTRRKVPCQILRIPVQIGAHAVLQSLQQSPSIELGYAF